VTHEDDETFEALMDDIAKEEEKSKKEGASIARTETQRLIQEVEELLRSDKATPPSSDT